MKKIFLVFVAFLSLVSLKLFAEKKPVYGEEYLCMWDSEVRDCVDGNKNYCICIKE